MIRGIEQEGLLAFLDRYQKAKKGPRLKCQVDPIVKRWVWDIREREAGCCGQKIAYFLDLWHGASEVIEHLEGGVDRTS